MIYEIANLEVLPSQAEQFELAFEKASKVISAVQGFISLGLQKGIEITSNYLLIVGWRAIEDHTVNFRSLPAHDEWKSLLSPFYISKPHVYHTTSIMRIE